MIYMSFFKIFKGESDPKQPTRAEKEVRLKKLERMLEDMSAFKSSWGREDGELAADYKQKIEDLKKELEQ